MKSLLLFVLIAFAASLVSCTTAKTANSQPVLLKSKHSFIYIGNPRRYEEKVRKEQNKKRKLYYANN